MKLKLYLIALCCTLAWMSSSAQLPAAWTNININNINAGITSTNDLFWDYTSPKFEVPAGSGIYSIWAGGLWISGIDPGGAIHMAGQTYRQTGNDFYPGPIDTATISPLPWQQWDTTWKLNQSQVQDHIQNYNIPGYVVPADIANWPGYNAQLNRVLAPFADYNSNGIYDPENGDYPYILGDQTVYSIYNDISIHTETNCTPLNLEFHRTMFGFNQPSNPDLNNSIFSRYEIKNYSGVDYHDIYITMWIDFDIGFFDDDYVGTDINLDMIYGYNGDLDDETFQNGYGLNPPAMGVYFLNDSLTGSMAYENINSSPFGIPLGCNDFLNYSHSTWLDNQPITYGAMGRDVTNPVTKYMYPGNTEPTLFPLYGEWSEVSAGNPAYDRRMIGTIGPFDFVAGEYKSIDVGFTWARATSGGPLASVAELQNAVSNLRTMYNNGLLTSNPAQIESNSIQFKMYPNPASDLFTIENNSTYKSYEILIQDAIGRVVYQKQNVKDAIHHIDLREISDGIYFVTMIQDNKMLNQKLIIK